MIKNSKPSYLNFDKKDYAWKSTINYRDHPEQYRIGKGEQGVLICEPYKSELIPYWRFKTPDIAAESSRVIYGMFKAYLKNNDFVGADIARKFLQMGFTRARRYANYKGGKKYDKDNDYALNERNTGNPAKAKSASIFYKLWKKAEAHPVYAFRKLQWKTLYG